MPMTSHVACTGSKGALPSPVFDIASGTEPKDALPMGVLSGGGTAMVAAGPDDFGHFDYIIIGAGSAGAVIANRLSASGRQRVLLLEAGPADDSPWIHIPIGYAKLFNNPRYNWMYETEPEPELNGRKIYQPRGKVLGGTSSINGLVYIRGQKEDYDGWAQMGNIGWSFAEVLPLFKRAEDQQNGADDYHGVGGPLAVSNQTEPHELCEAFIHAGMERGLPRKADFNGAEQEGIGYFQSTARNGRRCSTAVGYLKPVMKRDNLRIVTEALTEKIVFEGKRASGVLFRHQGQLKRARATREIMPQRRGHRVTASSGIVRIWPSGTSKGHWTSMSSTMRHSWVKTCRITIKCAWCSERKRRSRSTTSIIICSAGPALACDTHCSGKVR